MKAIWYRDLITLKNQKRNFVLSLIFLLAFPLVVKYNNLGFLNTSTLFLLVSSIIPATIGLQFSNYLLLEDRKSEMFPLLFRNGISILKYYISKAVVPALIAIIFNLIYFFFNNLMFDDLVKEYKSKELILLFFVSTSLMVIALLISETLIFVVSNDVYYPTACVISSIAIIGLIFYFLKPVEHIYLFALVILAIGLINYLWLRVLLKRKYSYFGS